MVWDMQVDRGNTTLSVWTRSRGAYVWPLPSAPLLNLTDAVSRQTHGAAGDFDVELLTGPAIEPRNPSDGTYHIVFTFSNTMTGCGVANTGTVTPGPNANQCTVNVSGLTNGQHSTISLTGVLDSQGHTGTFSATMGLLIGDTNADAFVNSADIGQTKSQSGQPVGASNFREDLNVDGFINSADIGLVKSKSGTALQ
jgi:hypothetical protein